MNILKIIIVSTIIAVSCSDILSAQKITIVPPPPAKGAKSASMQHVVNPEIPMAVYFAGEKVNFDRLDMYERLDRELTSLVYGHGNTLLTIKRANRYFPQIIPILRRCGIPQDFIYMVAVESYFNLRAYSPANAAGMWQFLAGTAKQYGLEVNSEVDERYDPEKATIAACKYLKDAYDRYGDWSTVAASYNGGMTRLTNELSSQMEDTFYDLYLTEETSRYVFRIIAMKLIFENPKAYGFRITADQLYQPVKYKTVEVSEPVPSWSEWAQNYGISYALLREMNPWIRSKSLTNKSGKTYTVKIPFENELYRSKRNFKSYNKNWITD